MAKFFSAVETLPLSPGFALEDATTVPEYDTVVVGSDEVWNLRHPWYGRVPLFFGEGLPARRIVAYAASFGNHDAAAGLDRVWAERLSRFDAISVRDHNSLQLVEHATGRTPPVVLDPCLQFPPIASSAWEAERPFVAVYGHNFSPAMIEQVRRWAAGRSLPTVSISYRNDWADLQWLDAGPFEFAAAIAAADAVVTNFFHGVVFAINHDKPFVCEGSEYRANKISGLTDLVGASDRVVGPSVPADAWATALSEPLDTAVHETITGLRAASAEFLHAALI
jgi:polysaccharide pyruvyl transferase WcaK-like protein